MKLNAKEGDCFQDEEEEEEEVEYNLWPKNILNRCQRSQYNYLSFNFFSLC